jgi:uncharacterized protein YjbI with pentapeptide repeats
MLTLKDSNRTRLEDKEVATDLSGSDLGMHLLLRVSAKERTFNRVSFRYTIFDNCYLRKCRFQDCDFTGAQFVGSNLRESSFDGSRFDYCRFSSSIVPHTVLQRHLPGFENVARELARSLRVNYGQLGDATGVNLAIAAELRATKAHLQKAAWSAESYYRRKYRGLARLRVIAENASFHLQDWVWGNGESVLKVFRSIVLREPRLQASR